MTELSAFQLEAILRRFGVDDDELLDALKWKYRKIYTEKEMAIRERDMARAELKKQVGGGGAMGGTADLERALERATVAYKEVCAERDRLREELKALKGDAWEEAGQ